MPQFKGGPVRQAARTARKLADVTVLSLVNLATYFGQEGPSTIGSVPKDIVFERGKLTLYRLNPLGQDEFELGPLVHPIEAPRVPVPVLVIPPHILPPPHQHPQRDCRQHRRHPATQPDQQRQRIVT